MTRCAAGVVPTQRIIPPSTFHEVDPLQKSKTSRALLQWISAKFGSFDSDQCQKQKGDSFESPICQKSQP
jgi:hypothetical protein